MSHGGVSEGHKAGTPTSKPGLPSWTQFANGLSIVFALVVLSLGVWFVVWPSWNDPLPAASNTVVKTTKTTTNPMKVTDAHAETKGGTTTDTKTTEAETKVVEQTDVTTPETPSLFERYLAKGHLATFMLFGVVGLAALLAGAVVQRILRAQYGIQIGPLNLPALADAAASTTKATEELKGVVAKQRVQLNRAIQHATEAVEAPSATARAAALASARTLLESQDADLRLVDEHLNNARTALRKAGV